MERNLVCRIEVPGVASKSLHLILKDVSEEDAEEIVEELDALLRQGVREQKAQGHKISIG